MHVSKLASSLCRRRPHHYHSTSMVMASTSSASSLSRSASGRKAPSFSVGANVSRTTVTSTPLPPVTVQIEASKRLAAYAAVDAYVKPEHKVIGIGSGTTVPYVVERLLQQGEELNADVGIESLHVLESLNSERATLVDLLASIPVSYSAGSFQLAFNQKNLS